MSLIGNLLIADISGESQLATHEDEIAVHGVHWRISNSVSSKVGRGRKKSRAKISSLTCYKETDAASAYLALACMQGKSIPDAVLSIRKDSGDAHLDYLVITMENVVITGFDMANDGTDEAGDVIAEKVSLSFENVTYKYTVQADDHSAGDEHEITFDIAAGV